MRLKESVSRVDLARSLNVAPSTVGLYVDRLIDEGFLLEGAKAKRSAGRPPVVLELNSRAGRFVGVDFDARQIATTTVDFSQHVLQQASYEITSHESAEEVVDRIEQAIASADCQRDLLGIGIGVPGTIDSQRGRAIHYEHIRGWRQVSLVQRLTQRFRVPIYLENNIRALALAERWFGQARDVNDFICLGIRSGIGAGIVVQGELYRGHCDLAGEIGNWPCDVIDDGSIGTSTSTMTLEQIASVRAILHRITQKTKAGEPTSLVLEGDTITLPEMLRGAERHDPLVWDVLHQAALAVGHVLGQLNLLLNPKQIIVSGPLSGLREAFLQPIIAVVERHVPALHASKPQIVASRFGAYGGAIGAAALAVHRWKPLRS